MRDKPDAKRKVRVEIEVIGHEIDVAVLSRRLEDACLEYEDDYNVEVSPCTTETTTFVKDEPQPKEEEEE